MNEPRSPYLFYLFRLPDKSRLTLDISIESVSSYNPEYTHLTHISLLLSANDPRPPLARTPAIMLIICCPSRSELKRKRACKRATRADCVGYSLTHSLDRRRSRSFFLSPCSRIGLSNMYVRAYYSWERNILNPPVRCFIGIGRQRMLHPFRFCYSASFDWLTSCM